MKNRPSAVLVTTMTADAHPARDRPQSRSRPLLRRAGVTESAALYRAAAAECDRMTQSSRP